MSETDFAGVHRIGGSCWYILGLERMYFEESKRIEIQF
jgi:hypothetical protein